MKLRYIRAFLAIVETGSIRGASLKLGVSQPALTKALQDLEAQLGAMLITRTATGSAPTKAGQAFFERAKWIDLELRRAREEVSQMSGGGAGSVAVGLSPVASMVMAAEAVGRFRKSFPAAKLKIGGGVFDYALSGLRQGRFDFAVGGMPIATIAADVEVEILMRNQIVPWVRNGHPLAKARTLAELAEAELMLTSDDPSFVEIISSHFLKLSAPQPRIAVTCESFPALLELIPQTDLVAFFPDNLLANEHVASVMAPIPIAEPLPVTSLALIKKAGAPLTPLAEHLADNFRRLARRLAAALDERRPSRPG
ncbi:LysR substrate-binding domain-containing protein [Caulobacter sp. S45]|uniref:LysR substrate-binding domain-containing protein n=1 Tax=Caulobacter sp. S45 TaxID=1641861 RepID=UPI00131C1E6F|nr:LysR substrate-binding domain-containing protein [Caulobacter sp. S45]